MNPSYLSARSMIMSGICLNAWSISATFWNVLTKSSARRFGCVRGFPPMSDCFIFLLFCSVAWSVAFLMSLAWLSDTGCGMNLTLMAYMCVVSFLLLARWITSFRTVIPGTFCPFRRAHNNASFLSMVYFTTSPSLVLNAMPLSPWPRYFIGVVPQ